MQTEAEHVMQFTTNWMYQNQAQPRLGFDSYNPQAVTNRPIIPAVPSDITSKEAIKNDIRQQVEYYFSQDNLKNDKFLRENMDQDNYAPINLVATFNKMKSLTTDIQLITEALKESLKLEVDAMNLKVRPIDIGANHMIQIHLLIVRDLPQNYQEKNIRDMLKQCNCPDPMDIEMAITGIWYIKYEEEDKSMEAFEILKNFTLNGEQLKVRAKTSTTTERSRSIALTPSTIESSPLHTSRISTEFKYGINSDPKFTSTTVERKFVSSDDDSKIMDLNYQNTNAAQINMGFHQVNNLEQSVLITSSSGEVFQSTILPIGNIAGIRTAGPQIIKVHQVLPNTQIPPPQIAPPPIAQQIPAGPQMAVGYIPALQSNYQFITPQGIIWPHPVMPVDSQMMIGPVDTLRLQQLQDINRVRSQETVFTMNANTIRYFDSRPIHPFLHSLQLATPIHQPVVSEEGRDSRMRREVRAQTIVSMPTNMYQPYMLVPHQHHINSNATKPILINEQLTTSINSNNETSMATSKQQQLVSETNNNNPSDNGNNFGGANSVLKSAFTESQNVPLRIIHDNELHTGHKIETLSNISVHSSSSEGTPKEEFTPKNEYSNNILHTSSAHGHPPSLLNNLERTRSLEPRKQLASSSRQSSGYRGGSRGSSGGGRGRYDREERSDGNKKYPYSSYGNKNRDKASNILLNQTDNFNLEKSSFPPLNKQNTESGDGKPQDLIKSEPQVTKVWPLLTATEQPQNLSTNTNAVSLTIISENNLKEIAARPSYAQVMQRSKEIEQPIDPIPQKQNSEFDKASYSPPSRGQSYSRTRGRGRTRGTFSRGRRDDLHHIGDKFRSDRTSRQSLGNENEDVNLDEKNK